MANSAADQDVVSLFTLVANRDLNGLMAGSTDDGREAFGARLLPVSCGRRLEFAEADLRRGGVLGSLLECVDRGLDDGQAGGGARLNGEALQTADRVRRAQVHDRGVGVEVLGGYVVGFGRGVVVKEEADSAGGPGAHQCAQKGVRAVIEADGVVEEDDQAVPLDRLAGVVAELAEGRWNALVHLRDSAHVA